MKMLISFRMESDRMTEGYVFLKALIGMLVLLVCMSAIVLSVIGYMKRSEDTRARISGELLRRHEMVEIWRNGE